MNTNSIPNPDNIPGWSLLPHWLQVVIFFAFAVLPFVGRMYQSAVSGGGLKEMASAVWLGTNQPKTPASTPAKVP